ncbi:hypothetical protein GCM10009584_28960 [Ornithinimicrobium humiphilum]|uniref:Subtilase family protein n=1 Tax=Ornithinimicrobium humiphilum TaxID=125288 RepID=A0A543K859_9MICO|nr:S8 family serine peptidase [Ornithinimicrobium humiphilum]TQM91276.1 subtilase family protein [Ornithinimicrobium humiphilum]
MAVPEEYYGRLDLLSSSRCDTFDASTLNVRPGRHLLAVEQGLTEEVQRELAGLGAVRWVYEQLGILEIDCDDPEPVRAVLGVVGCVPALATVDRTRGVVVGLDALAAFAARQANDDGALYRHPPGSGYPVLRENGIEAQLDWGPDLELPTPPAIVPVVNLSLGTLAVGFPTTTSDAVNMATAAASGEVLVVVAAGNCGDQGEDTLSAWARPEWVLSVGATEDADGTRIAAYSSRGGPGPDLVAHGASDLNPAQRGTSFAAPKVTFLARLVTAAFCQLGREIVVAQTGRQIGVPAVGRGIIDSFGREIWWEGEDATALLALPLIGVRRSIVEELVRQTGDAMSVRSSPELLRQFLLSAARPVPGASSSTAGAGFVDVDAVIERLATVTLHDLWQWFGPSASALPEALLSQQPFDRTGLHHLASVVAVTGPTVKFDYRAGRWAALPVLDDQIPVTHPEGIPVGLGNYRR